VETTTFKALVAAGALALVVMFALVRVRAVERERRTLARLVDERTRELATRNDELGSALAGLKRAETDLVRAERMASVATLVRGIAHELNNPLSFVAGNIGPLRRYADFLSRAVREVAEQGKKVDELRLGKNKDLAFVERDLGKLLDDVEDGAKRARLIVGDLQSLTGGPSRAIEPVDLAKVITQSVRLLAASKPDAVTIAVDAEPTAPLLARAGEMEQAVVNLVDNAIRAVGERGAITITLRADADARVIVVGDDGPGMTESVRARATEPFFTTRAAGEGSGLGLAIVATIAEHHDGSVEITSVPGKGTTVTLTVRPAKDTAEAPIAV
jgi:signal transduction histidine kinase